jgi:hypothetical protein
MNIFNRIVMIIAILLLLSIALALIIMPLEVISLLRTGLDNLEQSIFDPTFYNIYLGVLALIVLLLLIWLWLEIRRRYRKTVIIKTQGGGSAELGTQSVAQGLEYRIDELAGVQNVVTHVNSRGRDVDVSIDVDTSPSVNIPVLTDQILALTREVVEKQLGVPIHGRVHLRVRHQPYPRGTMPVSGAMGDEALVPPGRPRPTPPTPPAERRRPEVPPSIEREPRSIPSTGPSVVSPVEEEVIIEEVDEDQLEEQKDEDQESSSGW